MRNDISAKIRDYANTNPAIESIFFVKRFDNDHFIKIYTVVNEVIIAKLEDELKELFNDYIFVNRNKQNITIDKKDFSYTIIDLYKNDNIKISESIIASDMAKEFIKTLPNDIEFLYNKPGTIRLSSNNEFAFRTAKEYEFKQIVSNFFANALEISLYLLESNNLAASIKMDSLRSELINMLAIHVINKYHGTKNKGADGSNFIHTLSKEYKDDLEASFSDADSLNIYNALFKACVLFRKVGMAEASDMGFEYDRQTDVRTLRLLRENYKKIESFLN